MSELYNRTRRSRSIPLKLLRQGRPLAVPVYWLIQASDLGREGIENSGSYRFADHIYRNVPSGKGRLGRWLDAKFLALPAVRSFRSRFLASRNALAEFLAQRLPEGRRLDVLSAPCGIPRELAEGAASYSQMPAATLERVTFHGLDLNPDVLREATDFAKANGLLDFVTHHGNALDRATYPAGADFITSTGLAEFLDDAQLEQLYRVFHDVLRPGGLLITSGMQRRWVSEYFLRLAELRTHYRSPEQLENIARRIPFREVSTRTDQFGIQSILTART